MWSGWGKVPVGWMSPLVCVESRPIHPMASKPEGPSITAQSCPVGDSRQRPGPLGLEAAASFQVGNRQEACAQDPTGGANRAGSWCRTWVSPCPWPAPCSSQLEGNGPWTCGLRWRPPGSRGPVAEEPAFSDAHGHWRPGVFSADTRTYDLEPPRSDAVIPIP